MNEPAHDVLDAFRQKAGLSHGELWLRYFDLGGMSTGFELEAFLFGVLAPSDHDHDVIAHALNERFVELGGNLMRSAPASCVGPDADAPWACRVMAGRHLGKPSFASWA
jgi:hypothetical protein